MRLPDFMIVGAMKCGTSALHDILAQHPGLFMSNPKEPNFFSDDQNYARGLTEYANLFAEAEQTALCGESSTHYTKYPTYPDTVERMRAHFQALKLVYVIRHPVDRLVSQYIHQWTEREVCGDIDLAVQRHPELIAYSRYHMQIEPFVREFGRESVLLVLHQDFVRDPEATVHSVLRFLDVAADEFTYEVPEANVSARRLRRSRLRDGLAGNPVTRTLARTLLPESVRASVNSLWQMRKRPELSAATIAALTEQFDADLQELSETFGVRLSCETFKQTSLLESPVCS